MDVALGLATEDVGADVVDDGADIDDDVADVDEDEVDDDTIVEEDEDPGISALLELVSGGVVSLVLADVEDAVLLTEVVGCPDVDVLKGAPVVEVGGMAMVEVGVVDGDELVVLALEVITKGLLVENGKAVVLRVALDDPLDEALDSVAVVITELLSLTVVEAFVVLLLLAVGVAVTSGDAVVVSLAVDDVLETVVVAAVLVDEEAAMDGESEPEDGLGLEVTEDAAEDEVEDKPVEVVEVEVEDPAFVDDEVVDVFVVVVSSAVVAAVVGASVVIADMLQLVAILAHAGVEFHLGAVPHPVKRSTDHEARCQPPLSDLEDLDLPNSQR